VTAKGDLRCRECGREYPKSARYVCEDCFGPLEVHYAYDRIREELTRERIAARAPSMWRYSELLPLDGPPSVGASVGFTPLVRANRLGRHLGVRELWVKTDHASFPSLSFKDRVVSVAISKAREFGMEIVGCASTGNLANAVASLAASAGMTAFILIPSDLEIGKVLGTAVFGANLVGIAGTYDDVNRLCAEIAGRYGWGIVNVNLRPYYAEGSKSFGFEIAEQLGWRTPDHVVSPMAGGSLVTKIAKSFREFAKVGLIEERPVAFHGAQGDGCAPIVEAVRAGRDVIRPVKTPRTIAKSLAIGNPADGYYASRTILDSGGFAAAPTDEEIVAGIRLLAQTEGIFTETAGGVTVGAYLRLLEEGRIGKDGSTVLCITGQGLKTLEPLQAALPPPPVLGTKLEDFSTWLEKDKPEKEKP